jgi:hypothetical protein
MVEICINRFAQSKEQVSNGRDCSDEPVFETSKKKFVIEKRARTDLQEIGRR